MQTIQQTTNGTGMLQPATGRSFQRKPPICRMFVMAALNETVRAFSTDIARQKLAPRFRQIKCRRALRPALGGAGAQSTAYGARHLQDEYLKGKKQKQIVARRRTCTAHLACAVQQVGRR
jgi:hypothetical protein